MLMIITWHDFFPTSTTLSRLIVWYSSLILKKIICNDYADNADDGDDGNYGDEVDADDADDDDEEEDDNVDDNEDGEDDDDTCMGQRWQHLQELLPSHRWMPLNSDDDDDVECGEKWKYTNTDQRQGGEWCVLCGLYHTSTPSGKDCCNLQKQFYKYRHA